MSIFDFYNDLKLNAPVGNNLQNNDEDVRTVRVGLEALGHFGQSERERDVYGKPLGMITAKMDEKIRAFQRQENLKEDGRANPGGETITTMSKRLDALRSASLPRKKPQVLNHTENEDTLRDIQDSESDKSYMYKDNKGNVTIGVGKLLKDSSEAKFLPFVKYRTVLDSSTGEEVDEVLGNASINEIETAFKKIQNDKKVNYRAEYYNPSKNKAFLSIKLSDETRKAMALSNLFEHAQILRNRFKEFDNFPASAQEALLDLQYNTGLNPADWGNLYEAIKEKNWEKAAIYSHRTNVNDKRNKVTYDKLKNAAKK